MSKLINSTSRRVFDPALAEADATIIAEAYKKSGQAPPPGGDDDDDASHDEL